MNWLHLTASQFSIDPTSPSGLSRNGKPVGWDAGRYWRTKVKGKVTYATPALGRTQSPASRVWHIEMVD